MAPWPRVSLLPLLWISAPPCVFAAGDPDGPCCSAPTLPPADPPTPSRVPCAEARPTPAISATVPSRSFFLMVLRFIVSSSLVCSRTALAVTWIRGENRCGDDYVPLFAPRDCAVVSDSSLKTPIAHLSLIPQFTESTSSSRN